jgi:hypothetical protein
MQVITAHRDLKTILVFVHIFDDLLEHPVVKPDYLSLFIRSWLLAILHKAKKSRVVQDEAGVGGADRQL